MLEPIDRVINLAETNDDLLVVALVEAEQGFAGNTELPQAAERLLMAIRQNPQVFSRVAFAVTLAGVGELWLATMRRLEQEPGSRSDLELLTICTAFRNAGAYDDMQRVADMLADLPENDSPPACIASSKKSYERGMAAYQIGDFALSLAYFNLSYEQAMRGRDRVGALFALMNISGLVLPALGLWREGRWLSESVSAEANEIATNMTAEEANRPLRVVMNCYIHRIKIALSHELSVDYVRDLIERLERNPVYIISRYLDWAREPFEAAQRYIRGKQ